MHNETYRFCVIEAHNNVIEEVHEVITSYKIMPSLMCSIKNDNKRKKKKEELTVSLASSMN